MDKGCIKSVASSLDSDLRVILTTYLKLQPLAWGGERWIANPEIPDFFPADPGSRKKFDYPGSWNLFLAGRFASLACPPKFFAKEV